MNEFNDKNNSLTNYGTSQDTGSSYSSSHYYSGYDEEPSNKKKNGSTKAIAAAMVCSVLLSGAAGFGGGILASRFAEGESVQDVPSSSIASSMMPASSTPEANTVNTAVPSGAMTTAEIAAATADSVVEITTESVVTGGGFWVQQYVAPARAAGSSFRRTGTLPPTTTSLKTPPL